MVNVLVVGATGYIGRNLSQSLVRSGNHRVYGLARTEEKAKELVAEEVIPVRGSISDNAVLEEAIENFRISVVCDSQVQWSHPLMRLIHDL